MSTPTTTANSITIWTANTCSGTAKNTRWRWRTTMAIPPVKNVCPLNTRRVWAPERRKFSYMPFGTGSEATVRLGPALYYIGSAWSGGSKELIAVRKNVTPFFSKKEGAQTKDEAKRASGCVCRHPGERAHAPAVQSARALPGSLPLWRFVNPRLASGHDYQRYECLRGGPYAEKPGTKAAIMPPRARGIP